VFLLFVSSFFGGSLTDSSPEPTRTSAVPPHQQHQRATGDERPEGRADAEKGRAGCGGDEGHDRRQALALAGEGRDERAGEAGEEGEAGDRLDEERRRGG